MEDRENWTKEFLIEWFLRVGFINSDREEWSLTITLVGHFP